MTTVCPSDRIRPNYLFIYVSTTCDEKKNGCLRIDGVYLKGDMGMNERHVCEVSGQLLYMLPY